MAGNSNPNSIGAPDFIVGHFTDLTNAALAFLRSKVLGVFTEDWEVLTTSIQIVPGKSGASFVPLELIIYAPTDLTSAFAGQNFQIDDGIHNQTFAWDDYRADLLEDGVVRISLSGFNGFASSIGAGVNLSNLLTDNVGKFLKATIVGYYNA